MEKAFELKLQCEESDRILRRHLSDSVSNFDPDVFSDNCSDICNQNTEPANHQTKVDIDRDTSTKKDFPNDSNSKPVTKQTSHAYTICGGEHEDSSTLVDRMQQTHSKVVQKKKQDVKEQLVCTICHKVYIKANNLVAHMNTHTGNKLVECAVCSRSFTQGRAYACHLRTHSDFESKQHQCEICKKEFTKTSQLQVRYNA